MQNNVARQLNTLAQISILRIRWHAAHGASQLTQSMVAHDFSSYPSWTRFVTERQFLDKLTISSSRSLSRPADTSFDELLGELNFRWLPERGPAQPHCRFLVVPPICVQWFFTPLLDKGSRGGKQGLVCWPTPFRIPSIQRMYNFIHACQEVQHKSCKFTLVTRTQVRIWKKSGNYLGVIKKTCMLRPVLVYQSMVTV